MTSYFHLNERSKNRLICNCLEEPTQAKAQIFCDPLFWANGSEKGKSASCPAICRLLDLKTFENDEFKMQKQSL